MWPVSLEFLLLLSLHCLSFGHAEHTQPEETFLHNIGLSKNGEQLVSSEEDISSLWTEKTLQLLSEAIEELAHTRSPENRRWLESYIFKTAQLSLDIEKRLEEKDQFNVRSFNTALPEPTSSFELSNYPAKSANQRNQTSGIVFGNEELEYDDIVQQLHAQTKEYRPSSKITKMSSIIPNSDFQHIRSVLYGIDQSSAGKEASPSYDEALTTQINNIGRNDNLDDSAKSLLSSQEDNRGREEVGKKGGETFSEEQHRDQDSRAPDLNFPATNRYAENAPGKNEANSRHFNHSPLGLESVLPSDHKFNQEQVSTYNDVLLRNLNRQVLTGEQLVKSEGTRFASTKTHWPSITESANTLNMQHALEFPRRRQPMRKNNLVFRYASEQLNSAYRKIAAFKNHRSQFNEKNNKGKADEVENQINLSKSFGENNYSAEPSSEFSSSSSAYLRPSYNSETAHMKTLSLENKSKTHPYLFQPEEGERGHQLSWGSKDPSPETKEKYISSDLWKRARLSEKDMEDQLRAGKVIILSDSIVPSNFENKSFSTGSSTKSN